MGRHVCQAKLAPTHGRECPVLAKPWAPLDAPFRPAGQVPWCWRTGLPSGWHNFVGFWSVEPETRWVALDEVEARLPHTAQPIVLAAGTAVSLVAIAPCDDPNGSCGYWQGQESAHAFRVEGGAHEGSVVAVWGWLQEPPTGLRCLEPDALVSFRDRVEGRLQTLGRPTTAVTEEASARALRSE
jgi:hypothetical protein